MDAPVPAPSEKRFEISESSSAWTFRILSALRSRLSVKIRLHRQDGELEAGEIFLFNHFARFETFIPQFLIHEATGAYCRSVASKEFFVNDDFFGNYLLSLGAVPNDYPYLLPFLAAEVLRGRKIVIFPEGGMVKDRRVVDKKGRYNIYSSSAKERRKHHAGAAVLAVTLDAFREGLKGLAARGESGHLKRWARTLGMDNVKDLMAAVNRATSVIPSNITFYPIRLQENLLKRAAEIFGGGMHKNFSEELLIEGNILLRDTDMDIRLGNAVGARRRWNWYERKILIRAVRQAQSLNELFHPEDHFRGIRGFALTHMIRTRIFPLRDGYMEEMYSHVTINLSHLASRLIMTMIGEGRINADQEEFHNILYMSIKGAQKVKTIFLHESLLDPEYYRGLPNGQCLGLAQLLRSAERAELIASKEGRYEFLPDLRREYDFHEIRMENPIAVYANEMEPIRAAVSAVETATKIIKKADRREIARARFDDMQMQYVWEKTRFSHERYAEINAQETATESGEPYMLMPKKSNGLGVVLVHGFLASPAELREFGDRLVAAGHPVIGVRLNGHGTSPWDLRDRDWKNWQEPVRDGYEIMSAFVDKIALVGFSTGGTLALILAAEKPEKLAGVVAVSAPVKFMNRNLIFVPLVHGANKIARWVPSLEGVMPFRQNESEHPDINYHNMAIRGLYELRRVADTLDHVLPDITCPVAIIQGDRDGVVDPRSADLIFEKLGSTEKIVEMVPSSRHGILNENIGNAQEIVLRRLAELV
jgi:esterase/lipase